MGKIHLILYDFSPPSAGIKGISGKERSYSIRERFSSGIGSSNSGIERSSKRKKKFQQRNGGVRAAAEEIGSNGRKGALFK